MWTSLIWCIRCRRKCYGLHSSQRHAFAWSRARQHPCESSRARARPESRTARLGCREASMLRSRTKLLYRKYVHISTWCCQRKIVRHLATTHLARLVCCLFKTNAFLAKPGTGAPFRIPQICMLIGMQLITRNCDYLSSTVPCRYGVVRAQQRASHA